jgi:hypothetical protein
MTAACVLILWLAEPNWVKLIDENGNRILSWPLVVCYSVVFGCLAAAAMLLWKTKDRPVVPKAAPSRFFLESTFEGYY